MTPFGHSCSKAEVYGPESTFDGNGRKGSLSQIVGYGQLQCSKGELLAALAVNTDLRGFCFICA